MRGPTSSRSVPCSTRGPRRDARAEGAVGVSDAADRRRSGRRPRAIVVARAHRMGGRCGRYRPCGVRGMARVAGRIERGGCGRDAVYVHPAAEEPVYFEHDHVGVAERPLHRVCRGEAGSADTARLWLRAMDATEAIPLAATEGAGVPFWSPDSRFIAFFADGKLKKMSLSGAPPQVLCDAGVQGANRGGGAWNQNDVIVFQPSNNGPLFRVSSAGGVPVAATKLDESQARGRKSSTGIRRFYPTGVISCTSRSRAARSS